jgi:hypothetical protein
MGYLWDRVRVRGGAYGAFCRIDRHTGVASLVSYRDPNIENTLAIFAELPAFLARLELPRAELEKAVIGAVGDLDAHLLPDAKGFVSLQRHLAGLDEATRQRTREEVLGTGLAELRAVGDSMVGASGTAVVGVLGGRAPQAPLCREIKLL